MSHHASRSFWSRYLALRPEIRALADEAFEKLKSDPHHPSLHFKKVGPYWSARVGKSHRVLGTEDADGIVWFWIGKHDEYDSILR